MNNPNGKSRRVVLRLKIPLYEFLDDFAHHTKRTMSDVIRNAIEDFYTRMFLNRLNPTTKQLQKEFVEKFGKKENRILELKKRKIRIDNL